MPSKTNRLAILASAGVLALAGVAAGCGGDDGGDSGSSSSGGGGDKGGKIALLLPENKTARYEAADRPFFTDKVKELCSDCEVLYSNAAQDPSKQQSQAEAAITNGAKVLVLDPVDAASAGAIVTRAKQSDIPVVSYDRLVSDAELDAYISFDNEKIGELQAQALVDKLGDANGKSIVMINGSPTDNNATLFKKGAHSVLDSSGVKIAKEYDTPDWSPDKAQQEMEQAITAIGKDNIDGVYAANDGTAGGAIAAMKAAGIDPTSIPITGQDAELAGVQRVVAGEQYMTIYKAIKPEAEATAQIAVNLLKGEDLPSEVSDKTNNGKMDVPSQLFDATVVTQDNVNDTVVKDGFLKAADICTGAYAKACKSAGIDAGQ